MSVRATMFRQIDRLSRLQKRAVFLAVDMVLAPMAFAAALHADLAGTKAALILVAIAGIAAATSAAVGLPRIKLNAYGRDAALTTAKFAVLMAFGAAILCRIAAIPITAKLAADFAAFLFLCCVSSRYIMLTALLWVLRQGQTRCRVLIYGAGDTGLQMAVALRNHPRLLPVAFVDDDADLQAVTVAGLPVLSPKRLEFGLHDLGVDRVLLAMPSAPPPKLAHITRKLRALGLEVQALPSFAQLAGAETIVASQPLDLPGQILGRAVFCTPMADGDSVYAGRVVLVSGAGGSVGSELCRQLIAHHPKSLVLYERSELALYAIDKELRALADGQSVQIIPVLGSVCDARLARSTMTETGTEVVFHAAAYKHLPLVEANPVAGLANNVIGTRTFCDAAVAAGVSRFVLISTDKAVRPSSVMGATKRLAELVVQDLAKRAVQTRFSTVRFGNVLGSSGSVLPLFHDQIAKGGPVTLTHDDVTRYFMTLAEAARLVLMVGAFTQSGGLGDIFVLDMGKPVKIRDLAERMIKAEGLSVRGAANPSGDIEIVVTGLRPGEKLHEELLIGGQMLPTWHPKILRTQEVGLSEFAMASALNAARAAVDAGDQRAARAAISAWVDGFPNSAGGQFSAPPIGGEACAAFGG